MFLIIRLKAARATRWAKAGCLTLAPSGGASAQETAETKALKERLDRQDAQIKMLMDELQKQKGAPLAPVAPLDPAQVRAAVQDELKAVEEAKTAEMTDKLNVGVEVGGDRAVNGSFYNDGLHFQSANKDFDIHLGGRINDDFVLWH